MNKKELSKNETLFRLDMWMARHQRICWLILAVLALGCAAVLALTRLVPEQYVTAAMFAAMMLLLFLYRWMAGAPLRSLRKWGRRLEKGNLDQGRELLAYVQDLEKTLPDGTRRQLNYFMTGWKASLMADLGQKDEALALLKGFDQYWDESQRIQFQKLIKRISGEEDDTEQKEN